MATGFETIVFSQTQIYKQKHSVSGFDDGKTMEMVWNDFKMEVAPLFPLEIQDGIDNGMQKRVDTSLAVAVSLSCVNFTETETNGVQVVLFQRNFIRDVKF